jgi:hypothetical protein
MVSAMETMGTKGQLKRSDGITKGPLLCYRRPGISNTGQGLTEHPTFTQAWGFCFSFLFQKLG